MDSVDPKAIIGILDKPASLAPILAILLRTSFAFEDILVVFDYDQTLTQKDGMKGSIRGGEPTRNFLVFMNEHKIKWYINTARGPGSVGAVAQSCKNLGIPFSPISIVKDQKQCFSEKPGLGYIGYSVKDNEGVEIGLCNNIISAGYNKDIAIDFILKNLSSSPKLVIFVDDNAINVYNVYQYFRHIHPTMYFLGVVYEPYASEEEDHKMGLDLIQKSGAHVEVLHSHAESYNANYVEQNIQRSLQKRA